MQDYEGDFDEVEDGLTYKGPISIAAKAPDRQGNVVDIIYSVDVSARVPGEWDEGEEPHSWNYKSDTINYKSNPFLSLGDVEVTSVTFTPGEVFNINGDDVPPQQAQQMLGPEVIKQLVNPTLYQKLMKPAFQRKAETIPVPDYEPDDRRDYDYDR